MGREQHLLPMIKEWRLLCITIRDLFWLFFRNVISVTLDVEKVCPFSRFWAYHCANMIPRNRICLVVSPRSITCLVSRYRRLLRSHFRITHQHRYHRQVSFPPDWFLPLFNPTTGSSSYSPNSLFSTPTAPSADPSQFSKISEHAKYFESLYPHATPQQILSYVTMP